MRVSVAGKIALILSGIHIRKRSDGKPSFGFELRIILQFLGVY
jgi:hypothetical protein